MDITRIVALLLSSSILFFVIWLIREGRLREKYALLWLFTSLIIIALAASRQILETAAIAVGIFYPPSLLFLLGLLFLLLVNIGYAVSLSRLSESNHILAQEVALLKKELADRSGEQKSCSEGMDRLHPEKACGRIKNTERKHS